MLFRSLFSAAIGADSKFSTVVENSNQVVVTLLEAGSVLDVNAGDTGWTMSIDQQGEDSDIVDVSDLTGGARTDSADIDTGFAVTTLVQGTNAVISTTTSQQRKRTFPSTPGDVLLINVLPDENDRTFGASI